MTEHLRWEMVDREHVSTSNKWHLRVGKFDPGSFGCKFLAEAFDMRGKRRFAVKYPTMKGAKLGLKLWMQADMRRSVADFVMTSPDGE